MARNVALCIALALPVTVSAQSLSATPIQDLSFGAFFRTGSGTVTVSTGGVRSKTGSIVLADMGISYSPAIFEVKATSNSTISIVNGNDVLLKGSNGGTISLHLGTPSPRSPFTVKKNVIKQVIIGGTITVGSSLTSPAGDYSGDFTVTFAQQ